MDAGGSGVPTSAIFVDWLERVWLREAKERISMAVCGVNLQGGVRKMLVGLTCSCGVGLSRATSNFVLR